VLLVPNLSCNLVSIAKITKDLDYSVTFFDDFVVHRTILMPISVGEQRDEVYYYGRVPIKSKSNAIRAGDYDISEWDIP